ncbi:hypothetical protein NE857_01255 [Nocardiopsis exhalans]|uniref:Uncharacterized protein n=2 Tax=Nocardiopsis TaxID=2013 RepID=A0A840WD40_9ACTN|nr:MULTISPECIES: hypothetical protein [Nocardiopsis]MBB5494054.1 hypothetical protein [Nocardiopsis metallicus]USY20324.1 hypothetical protein NE857_01255 [Nocardiopsis exhalans]
MHDIYTRDLLTVLDEALHPPAHLTASQLAEWHAHTLRNRLPLIREALRIAREEADAELATLIVDQAISEHPDPTHALRPVGGDGASLPTSSEANLSCEDELPVPERILCPLLYKQWNLTIEGAAPHEIYVARRPFDWTGEGDRWERITAPTRRELLRLLGHRIQGTNPTGN